MKFYRVYTHCNGLDGIISCDANAAPGFFYHKDIDGMFRVYASAPLYPTAKEAIFTYPVAARLSVEESVRQFHETLALYFKDTHNIKLIF